MKGEAFASHLNFSISLEKKKIICNKLIAFSETVTLLITNFNPLDILGLKTGN